MDNWPDNWAEKAMAVILILGIVAIVVALISTTQTTPVTGRVLKMWIENGSLSGAANYITVETSTGHRETIAVFPSTYGNLDIGDTCTFEVDGHDVSQSTECNNPTQEK